MIDRIIEWASNPQYIVIAVGIVCLAIGFLCGLIESNIRRMRELDRMSDREFDLKLNQNKEIKK